MMNHVISQASSGVSAPLIFASLDDLVAALPGRAQAKVFLLRQARDDAHAVVRPLHDERNDLIRALWELEANLKRLMLPKLHGGNELTEDSPQVKRARAQIVAKTKRRDELIKLIDERGDRWGQLGQLVQNIEKFIAAHAPDGFRQHELIEPTIKKGETLPVAIERTRRRIRELEADRKRVASAPIPASECRDIVRKQIEALAARGAPDILPLVDQRGQIEFRREHINAVVGGAKEVTGVVTFQLPDTLALLMWAVKDVVLAHLDAEICDLVADDQALSDRDRAAALAQISNDMLACERDEEALVIKAEQEGIAVVRRSDANARAVLELV